MRDFPSGDVRLPLEDSDTTRFVEPPNDGFRHLAIRKVNDMHLMGGIAGNVHFIVVNKSKLLGLRTLTDRNLPNNLTPFQIDNQDIVAIDIGDVGEMSMNEKITWDVAERENFVRNDALCIRRIQINK